MGVFGNLGRRVDHSKTVADEKMALRKEELDIAKDKVRTGEVELSKDIVEERKIVDVPVTHEEVVIERRAIDNEPSDTPIRAENSIHIPTSRETVQVGKHTVVTGEVSAAKREVQDVHHVDETVKREEVHINHDGDPTVVDKLHDDEDI